MTPTPGTDPLPPVASEATLEALEFHAVRRLLASSTATDLGHQRALELQPCGDETDLSVRRNRYEEVARLVLDGSLCPSFEEPLMPRLECLASGDAVDGRDLLEIATLVRATEDARDRIEATEGECPALRRAVAQLPQLGSLARRIRRRLDRRGGVRDDASPQLERLRRQVRRQREAVYGTLRGLMADHRDALSEETVPSREGRLVLVLQAGARGRIAGLTHGRSGSGKSFYFEPLEVVESNNDLQQASEEAELERQRILFELAEETAAALPALERHAALAAELDLLETAWRLSERVDGRLAELSSPQELRLVGARHPLLDPRLAGLRAETLGLSGHRGEVVPLDLELTADERVLVVTGPNAGGKTVALKTVGLLALMSQSGLPIPAAVGTRFPVFRRIVASVGDEQDLLEDRSTFSGRLVRLREACEAADPEALILVDEVGSGTDPEEGEALAAALLELLVERQTLALLTTHLGAVAGEALERQGAACAAMEVDSATGEPRYHLQAGPPGASAALDLADRLGLPEELLRKARRRVTSEGRDYRRRLAEVDRLRHRLTAEIEALDTERQRLEIEREGLAANRVRLDRERKEVGRRLGAQLDEFRRRVRSRLDRELERIGTEQSVSRRRATRREVSQRLLEGAPELVPSLPEPSGPVELGRQVKHRSLGWAGKLERLDRGRAEVAVAGKRVRCRVDELVPADEERAEKAPTPAVAGPEASEVPSELNLIGARVEPALERLDAYLDRALLSGLPEVRIVHGHGSGRLREAVRDHLTAHPGVVSHRPGGKGEGGNGATVVSID